jgi:recombination DNA repair RAD52 pathway protein
LPWGLPLQDPGSAEFAPEHQNSSLHSPLRSTVANVRQREQGRSRVSYLEGWQVIAEANRIFGFDGWQRQTIAVRCVAQAERTIGRDQKPGWGVTYSARVRVNVTAGGLSPLVRQGSGAGHGIDVDLGQAHESALKEAETDAM